MLTVRLVASGLLRLRTRAANGSFADYPVETLDWSPSVLAHVPLAWSMCGCGVSRLGKPGGAGRPAAEDASAAKWTSNRVVGVRTS